MFRPADEYTHGQEFRRDVTLTDPCAESGWEVVPVKVIKRATFRDPDTGETEDGWQVRIPVTGKTIVVTDDALSPVPDHPELLSERFQRFTSDFESPLVAAFVLEAVDRYAADIMRDEAETLRQMENTMVAGPAWIAAAKRAKTIASMK